MDIQTLITTGAAGPLPLEQLRALAGNVGAFGQDVIDLFAGQAERRALSAGIVLTTADTESRDLLASEQRSYDRTMREAEQIRALQADVERRTAQRSTVPSSQQPPTETRAAAALGPVLGTEQRMGAWLQARGGHAYAGDQGADTMRLGALIAAMASGNRSRLTELERRALSEGTDSAGGFTVPEVVAASFIDRVRAALVVQRAGARIVPMTSDTLHMARVAQPGLFLAGAPTVNAATAAWKLENALIAESSLVLERVTFTTHTLPLLLKMSVELFEDSANISEIVEQEMAASTALELDRVALVGTGTAPEPRGILNQTGVLTGSAAVLSAWDYLIDAAGALWAVNEEPTAAIFGTAMAITQAKFRDADGQPLV